MVRAVLGVLMLLAILFMADQEFADGRYTRIAHKAVIKVRTSIGI
jgi:hypothetical protein